MDFWRKITFFSIFGIVTVFLLFYVTLISRPSKGEDLSRRLPVINITLNDISLDEITENDKDLKYEGNELTLILGNKMETFFDVQIKGRGNSTWGLPKRPFRIKFKNKVDLLGLGARKKYILLANYVDKSNLRNDLMFKLSEMISEKYRVDGKFVELYINDEYQGLYNLVTKIEIGKEAVDLRDEYGILMELDTLHQDVENCHYSGMMECLVVKEAVFEDDEEKLKIAIDDFMTDFNKFEKAVIEGDYVEVSELIDIESFAHYVLISEFGNNPDSYVSSFYFYKNGFDGKIHVGPLWDYDYAFSNRDWYWGFDDRFYDFDEFMVQRDWIKEGATTEVLMYYLYDMPEFQNEVRRVWGEKMSGRKSELMTHLDRQFKYIKKAALLNEKKWFGEARFLDEFEYLRDWVDRRFDFFEQKYGDNTPL